ncbi:MAG: GNAT family N-acetyltransferase [Pseudomonadota bacterium]
MITLRPATPSDAPHLRRWDKDPGVIAASGEDDEWHWEVELARTVDWRATLIIEEDGRPVGVVQIIDAAREETHYWGDGHDGCAAIDIWIGAAEDRGRGTGATAMALAADHAFADPAVEAILIDPLARNEGARRFYARIGYKDVGPRRFGDDDCIVMRLDRADWEGRPSVASPSASA